MVYQTDGGEGMVRSAHEIVNTEKFKKFVARKWTVSFILTFLLFVIYFGYIFTVAYGKDFLAQKVGVYTNVGIVFGILVIVGAWVLTIIYIIWANSSYDKEVEELKKQLR